MARRPDCPCSGCGKLLWSTATSRPAGERLCRPCRRARREIDPGWRGIEETACARCGSPFKPDRRSRRQLHCSLTCANLRRAALAPRPTVAEVAARRERERQRLQQKNRRRRAQVRGAGSEPYSLAEIARRDRRRCGLCGERVAMTKAVPHPRSPVVDHVVPLAKGGSDLRTNVQLAHYRCNASKGAAGGGEQLALIG